MKKGTNNRTDIARERSRELRQSMGVTETIFWNLIRNRRNGFKFRRQHAVGPYILDFYCREASLAVELDGEQHADQRRYDEARDRWLASRGIDVLRIPTLDFFDEDPTKLSKWIDRIEAMCRERSEKAVPENPHPQPPLP